LPPATYENIVDYITHFTNQFRLLEDSTEEFDDTIIQILNRIRFE